MSELERREDIKRREEEIRKFSNDPFQPEVDVIAYIRAYYRVAAPRFVDSIAQYILCRIIPAIEDELSFYINEQLGLVPSASATIYERLVGSFWKHAVSALRLVSNVLTRGTRLPKERSHPPPPPYTGLPKSSQPSGGSEHDFEGRTSSSRHALGPYFS